MVVLHLSAILNVQLEISSGAEHRQVQGVFHAAAPFSSTSDSARSNSGLEPNLLTQIERIYRLEMIYLIRSGNCNMNSCKRSTNFLQVLAITEALLWATVKEI